jgi:hypothetical protein
MYLTILSIHPERGCLGVYSGRQGRAVVVFFSSPATLQRFTSSPYYQQVGKKHLLEETQSHQDKEYVIKKAATGGQVGSCLTSLTYVVVEQTNLVMALLYI